MACRHEPNSRFVAAKAAIQGIYNTVNTKNVNALNGVNIAAKALFKAIVFEACVKTVNVDTTDSLAVIPVINAVDARQSPKPNGSNIGATNEPIAAKILWLLSVIISNLKLKLCKNQITIDAIKITVKALRIKSLALSHTFNKTFFKVGIR